MEYKPLERYFGLVEQGDAFGESCMFAKESTYLREPQRFYQAFAITDCYYATLHINDVKKVM